MKDSLTGLKDVLDYSKHGGGVLFGLKAPVVKTHGSTEKEAVYFTIKQIREMLASNVMRDLVNYFETKADSKEEETK